MTPKQAFESLPAWDIRFSSSRLRDHTKPYGRPGYAVLRASPEVREALAGLTARDVSDVRPDHIQGIIPPPTLAEKIARRW